MPPGITVYAFDSFRLDLDKRVLWNNGQRVPLTAKAFQTLAVLIEDRDRIVEKAELMKAVWPDTYTEESNLAHQILAIRKALGEFQNGKEYIETIARRGYRFVGNVRSVEEESPVHKDAPASFSEEAVPTIPQASIASSTGSVPRKAIAVVAVLVLGSIASRFLLGPIRHASEVGEITPAAKQNYEEGRFFWKKRTSAGYRAAIAHFQEAIRVDPSYAQAYAGLADAYILLGSFGIEPLGEVIPQARAAALRAIEIDDRSAEAHASMGYIMSRFDWNWEEASREFRRAVELNPGYATAHHWYALHLISIGRSTEAIAEIKRAQALEPDSLVLTTDTALVLFYARRYDEAIQECRKALAVDSSFGLAHRTLGAIYAAKGSYREAIEEYELATRILGEDPWMIAEIGRSYAMLGQQRRALSKLNELQELSAKRFVDPSAFALLCVSLPGRHNETFLWLEKEYEEHSNLAILTVHPGFDPIRQDPRFQSLLRRIRLPLDQGS